MSEFTKEEQLGLLKRGLTRRLVGANPAIKMKEEEMVDVPKGWVPQNDKLKIEGEE